MNLDNNWSLNLQISDAETKSLFESLYGMVHADAVFARFIMPHLIIVAIIENNAAYIADVFILFLF